MSNREMNDEFEFRVVLIQIQDSLSDLDRKQLNFLFGDDIPRRLQSDGSVQNSLDVLQTLFDRLKISKDNFNYLVRSLEAIQRQDCVQRLREYERLIPNYIIPSETLQNPINLNINSVQSTTVPTVSQMIANFDEEDQMIIPTNEPVGIKFQPSDPEPLDVTGIDLQPFEDSSCLWTEEYSKSLYLKYHPRNYQIEIIRHAIHNGNTIICLRTGSGKTLIASILIKYYFIKRQKTNPNAKFLALFFVPRKAIRLQQAKAINDIGNLRVRICEDDQTMDTLLNNHVIISTPQKFVNCLKKETMYLSQIDLIIFDECHNTSGGNPYCDIMKYYLCPSKKQNEGEKPLIIGLTATISARDSQEKKDCVEKNLINLCSKLACRTISTVCNLNNIEEINREISRPQNDQFEYVSEIRYNSYFDEYINIFKNLISLIQRHLINHVVLNEQIIGSSGYIGQLTLLKRGFEQSGKTDNVIICDYLLLLTKRYSALKDLPFDAVLNHIMKEIDEQHNRYQRSVPMDDLLYETIKNELEKILKKHSEHSADNPKLDKLVLLLKQNIPTKNKGLILVQTTFYAKTLNDYISNHQELMNIVKSTWLVGQNSADFSLTIHEQEQRLKQFCEDYCNVLIATDIVQEGLDIPTCSYVIRYEFVSDEIGTIQSRGRARAQDSSYFLITEKDSVNHKREKNNKYREDDMDEAIEKWPTIDRNLFEYNVKIKTDNLIKTWDKELSDEFQLKSRLRKAGRKTGSICCRKCNRALGKLEWLKKRNTNYFINNLEFFTNNNCRLYDSYENFQENLVMGDVLCTCGNSLGGCVKFMDRSDLGVLCALKCKQIKFLIEDKMPFIEFAQWSKNDRFDVEEFEEI